ncbi:MAG: metallophosphoesterase family protein [Clostridia bacterium]|nr:metallophosphoesterase family protein [Clostridia bacterium]
MKEIALVADLHGNLPATLAVEKDIRSRGIERIWCLGDVVGKGPSSAETFDWAEKNCEFILQGNWDEGIGNRRFPADEFYYRQLGERRMQALRDFPLEYTCVISGRKTRLFHGRPAMPLPYYVHEDYELLAPYFAPDYNVVGYADVHRQGVRLLGFKGILFNTGSVGNGLGLGAAMAQYAIVRGETESEAPAPLDVTMVTVPYDGAQAVRDAEEAGKRGLRNWDLFIKEITTGVYARFQGAPRSPL